MSRSESILRACTHKEEARRLRAEVNMGHGEILEVCCECWNESVRARREDRKTQLASFWSDYAEKQAVEMEARGAAIGQRVQYFAPSMLGPAFGGLTLEGTIRRNRNGVAIVKLDFKYNGQSQVQWNHGWKEI